MKSKEKPGTIAGIYIYASFFYPFFAVAITIYTRLNVIFAIIQLIFAIGNLLLCSYLEKSYESFCMKKVMEEILSDDYFKFGSSDVERQFKNDFVSEMKKQYIDYAAAHLSVSNSLTMASDRYKPIQAMHIIFCGYCMKAAYKVHREISDELLEEMYSRSASYLLKERYITSDEYTKKLKELKYVFESCKTEE